MGRVHTPQSVEELAEIITAAAADGSRLAIRGGGSKDDIGAPAPEAHHLDMRGFSGIIDYDPPELVLTVGAGTPLAEVQAQVAAQDQVLAFEPWDHGRLLGHEPGTATIGGVIAAGVAGPGRLSAGGARDHLLGFEAVTGRGEPFKAGSRVVKNVTGFDLSKLVTGSWGRLVAMTQLTLKVLPRPETRETYRVPGLAPAAAVEWMAAALASPVAVAAAAHLPDWQGRPATLVRLEGFRESVAARGDELVAMTAASGACEKLDAPVAAALWRRVADATVLPADQPLWRLVVAPARAHGVLDALGDADWFLDWGGALVWATGPLDAATVRRAAMEAGGHAMLVRADDRLRRRVPAFHPPAAGIGKIENNLRLTFDPRQVFDTGRF